MSALGMRLCALVSDFAGELVIVLLVCGAVILYGVATGFFDA